MINNKKTVLSLSFVYLSLIGPHALAANIFASHPLYACKSSEPNAKCGSFGHINETLNAKWSGAYDVKVTNSMSYALMRTGSEYHLWVQSAGDGVKTVSSRGPYRQSLTAGTWNFGPLLSFTVESKLSHNGSHAFVLEESPTFQASAVSVSKDYSVSGTLGASSSPSGGLGISVGGGSSVSHHQRYIRSYTNNNGSSITHKVEYTPNLDWHYREATGNWGGWKYVHHVPLDINNLYTIVGMKQGDSVSYDYDIKGIKPVEYWSGTLYSEYKVVDTPRTETFNKYNSPVRITANF